MRNRETISPFTFETKMKIDEGVLHVGSHKRAVPEVNATLGVECSASNTANVVTTFETPIHTISFNLGARHMLTSSFNRIGISMQESTHWDYYLGFKAQCGDDSVEIPAQSTKLYLLLDIFAIDFLDPMISSQILKRSTHV